MSWQATAHAVEQKTGSPHSKLILLLLANRADEDGICWPSQNNLADQSEQSADTVQRHLKNLEDGGFIRRVRSRRTRGRWPGFIYQLLMPGVAVDELPKRSARKRARRAAFAEPVPSDPPTANPSMAAAEPTEPLQAVWTEPQTAARTAPLSAASPSRSQRFHRAAGSGVESSSETSIQTSPFETSASASESSGPILGGSVPVISKKGLSKGRTQTDDSVVQDRIARRLGSDGWNILQGMNPDQVRQIVGLERRGHLSDRDLSVIRSEVALPCGAGNPTTKVEVATPELMALLHAKGSR
jgi:hypothetical protein